MEPKWNAVYREHGILIGEPAAELVRLVPRLKAEGAREVLDAGCGAGRNSDYLAREGFITHAIDPSDVAIGLARGRPYGGLVDYRVADITSMPYADGSMDFVLASHTLEYAGPAAAGELGRVLKGGRPLLVRVLSTEHYLHNRPADEIEGFNQAVAAIRAGNPPRFFSEAEISELFGGYEIERLEHLSYPAKGRLTIPLKEWLLFAYKK
ncbi:MAG: methyltransferase domain-containing protein [Candidatus Aenigmarchaeota archaeon]|nr:methyltransferase domain-containing protein [Candidatus Aenigmarchaeota archaeon]